MGFTSDIRGAWARETIEQDFKKNLKLLDNSNELMKQFFESTENVNFKNIGLMETADFVAGLREGEAARTISKSNPALASLAVETNRYIQAMNREALEMPDRYLKKIDETAEEIRRTLPNLDSKINASELEVEIGKDKNTKEKIDKIEKNKSKTGKYMLYAIGAIAVSGTIYSALNALAEIRAGCIYFKTHNQTTVGCKIIKCSCSYSTVGSGMNACGTLPTKFPHSDCTCTPTSPQCLKCTASREHPTDKENYDPTILNANEIIRCVPKSVSATIADLYNELPRSVVGSISSLGNIFKYVLYACIAFGCCYLLFKLLHGKERHVEFAHPNDLWYSTTKTLDGRRVNSASQLQPIIMEGGKSGLRQRVEYLGPDGRRYQPISEEIDYGVDDRFQEAIKIFKEQSQSFEQLKTDLKNVMATELQDYRMQIQQANSQLSRLSNYFQIRDQVSLSKDVDTIKSIVFQSPSFAHHPIGTANNKSAIPQITYSDSLLS